MERGALEAFLAAAAVFGGYAPWAARDLLTERKREGHALPTKWSEVRALLEVAAEHALARHTEEVGDSDGHWPAPASFRPVSWRDFSGRYQGWAYGLGNTAAILVWRDGRPEPLWGVGWEAAPETVEEVERLSISLRTRLDAGRAALPAPLPHPVEESTLYHE